MHAGKAYRTRAGVRVDVLFAIGSVQTRLRQTFVDVHLAVTTGETVRTHTGIVADAVQTRGSVLAWCCETRHGSDRPRKGETVT